MSVGTVNTWFMNDRIPRVDVAVQIARALGTTVEYLVRGEHPTLRNLSAEATAVVQIMEELNHHDRRQIMLAVQALTPVMVSQRPEAPDTRAPKASGE